MKFFTILTASITFLILFQIGYASPKPVKHAHEGRIHTHVLPNNGIGRHSHNKGVSKVVTPKVVTPKVVTPKVVTPKVVTVRDKTKIPKLLFEVLKYETEHIHLCPEADDECVNPIREISGNESQIKLTDSGGNSKVFSWNNTLEAIAWWEKSGSIIRGQTVNAIHFEVPQSYEYILTECDQKRLDNYKGPGFFASYYYQFKVKVINLSQVILKGGNTTYKDYNLVYRKVYKGNPWSERESDCENELELVIDALGSK